MKKNQPLWNIRSIALMGMFGALAAVLMLIEFPLTFIAPSFYKLDISELPILIGSFALGPVAGVVMEIVKILVKLLIKPTSTAFVGELANFVVGCALVVPAGIIYKRHKSKKTAIVALVAGGAAMCVIGVAVNALVMLPFYANFMPLEQILAAGKAIWPSIDSVWDFALLIVGPFNLIKALLVSVITMFLYKRVSGLIHSFQQGRG